MLVVFAIAVVTASSVKQQQQQQQQQQRRHDGLATALSFSYSDGRLDVSLVGEAGEAARVTYVPKGANESFLRYQGFVNASALASHGAAFTVEKSGAYTLLSRPGWSLNVSHSVAVAALSVQGVVVSADVAPPRRVMGSACDPPGWPGLAPNLPAGQTIAGTVAQDRGGCLRATRSLSADKRAIQGATCCVSYQDPVGAQKAGGSTGPCVLTCPMSNEGAKIKSILFSEYGTPSGECGSYEVDATCDATNHSRSIRAVATAACVGKGTCTVTRAEAEGNASWGDPCWGNQAKRLVLSALCSGGPPPPTPAPPVTGVLNEQIYGFGQTVTPGLSAVGAQLERRINGFWVQGGVH